MRRVLLNLTTSLDGFIAGPGGEIDWILPPPDDVPAEYLALMETVDAYVMGRATYELTLELGGVPGDSEGHPVYVVTSKRDMAPRPSVEFVHQPPEEFVAELKEQDGGTIWLFGGGQLATALASAGLIDEYLIAVQPILLGEGIPLWHGGQGPQRLELIHARVWPGGLAELLYRPAEE